MGVRDPIEDSYEELVEGLRTLHEECDLDKFMADYTQWQVKRKKSEFLDFLAKYDLIKDKHYLRARSFLIAVFEEDEDPC